jgi:hypothetical protein
MGRQPGFPGHDGAVTIKLLVSEFPPAHNNGYQPMARSPPLSKRALARVKFFPSISPGRPPMEVQGFPQENFPEVRNSDA